MLYKTLSIHLTNPYPGIANDEQYYTHPVDMDIMTCLLSKGHYSSISGSIHPVQASTDCTLELNFSDKYAFTSYCFITVNTIPKIQLPNLALIIT